MKLKIFKLIKQISITLITGAIGLELWSIYAGFTHSEIPNLLIPILWLGRFAIAIHFVEGLIAAWYASLKRRKPLQQCIYTFFVGTVGLLELFDSDPETIKSND